MKTVTAPATTLYTQTPQPSFAPAPSIAERKNDINLLARWLQAAAHEQKRQAAERARERERLQQAAARYAAD